MFDISCPSKDVTCFQILSRLHKDCFSAGWSAGDFEALVAAGKVEVILAGCRQREVGFLVYRSVTDESEILTLGVLPEFRRQKIASQLLQGMIERLFSPVSRVLLEVATDNHPAVAFYEGHGFERLGMRKGYYVSEGKRKDAWTMGLKIGHAEV